MKDVFEQIVWEDLTEDLKMLANCCGVDTVRVILREFAGLNFYIPKLSRLEGFVYRYLKQNKSEKSFKQIAKELNVSETFLKTLLKRKPN